MPESTHSSNPIYYQPPRMEPMLGEDLRQSLGLDRCPVVRSASDVADLFRGLAALEREVLILGSVDCQLRLLRWDLLAVGASDHVFCRVGEIFIPPLRAGAHGVFLVHNHPSGQLRLSRADRDLTELVAQAGSSLGCPLHDHVVVGPKGYRSLMTRDLVALARGKDPAKRVAERNRHYRHAERKQKELPARRRAVQD